MKQSTKPLLLVGTPEWDPDLEYTSGFRAPDPIVLLRESGGRSHLVVSPLELSRARREAKHAEVKCPEDLGIPPAKRRDVAEWALALLRARGISGVDVPGTFPVAAADKLRRRGIRVHVKKGELLPERAIKRKDEVRMIRESQQAAVIAMRAAVEMISRSEVDSHDNLRLGGSRLTSDELRRTIAKVLLEHDCFCRGVIVACGFAAADPHEAGTGPLRAGEPIVFDIFPQHVRHGYWGDLSRTVVKGTPSRKLKKIYLAVRAAQAAALGKIRPGVKAATVHRAAVGEFQRRGFETGTVNGTPVGFIHSTGHGVGLGIHEPPALTVSERRLRCGNVVTVEPGLYYPDIGGVRIEDTVVVTPDGWRYLVPCEKRFEV